MASRDEEAETSSDAAEAHPKARADTAPGTGKERGRGSDRSGSATTAACAASAGTIEADAWRRAFSAERNAVYHLARESWYDACHSLVMFLVIVTSTGAVVGLAAEVGWAAYSPVIPVVLGALDMAFRFSEKARRHGYLSRRSKEVAADLTANIPTEDSVRAATGRLWAIYGEESAEFCVVNAIAYNQVARHVGRGEQQIPTRWWQRFMRHVLRFETADIRLPPEQAEDGG